jgi:hypothetical protein
MLTASSGHNTSFIMLRSRMQSLFYAMDVSALETIHSTSEPAMWRPLG